MKKFLTLTLAAALMISSATTALAVEISPFSIGDPNSANTTSNNNNVTVYGYIGPDATINPNPGGGTPGVATIDVTIPTQMIWAAYEDDFSEGSAPITSANHYVTCNSGSAGVHVSVTGFAQTNAAVLPASSTLSLGLAVSGEEGAPSGLTGVSDLFDLNGGVQIATLNPEDKIKVLVTGTYADTGAFPTTAIAPLYNMVLRLDAV